jgi:hypothetical protein
MYTLYTDKTELFECDVSVKNASLKNSVARLVVESDDIDLVFKGKINDGKCTVPIRKLKGILDENSKGNMSLEVIVEDTYFKPWSDSFVVEEHTSIKVAVKEQKQTSNKPILEVKVKNPVSSHIQKISVPVQEIVSICKIFEINSKNFKTSKRNDFKQLVKEYFKENKEFQKKMNPILNEVVSILK